MKDIFGQIIRNEAPAYKVWDENNIIAILDRNPINEGHLLVIPYEDVDDIMLLSESRYHDLWRTVRVLSQILKKAFNAPRIGIAVEGFGVPHVHIHLVPVFSGNELNPERAKSMPENRLEAVRKRILDAIRNG
ncbi:MAG: HIT family protein [Candidatus Omnitrophica bacterium]|nr:HIT family protein [Candidatus Omnitrophota bacterium]MDD5736980.1 HIT family protein [Candidatus Omnitrophota bacterium]